MGARAATLDAVNDLSRNFKIVTIWLLVGVAAFLAVQAWQQRQARTLFAIDGDRLEIRRGSDGHYHWPGRINDQPVDFLIDTGATGTAISASLARQLGLQSLGSVRSSTAGGPVTGQLVRGDLALEGGVRIERLRMVALPGLGERPLLGMDVLGRLRWSQGDGVLRIDLRPAPEG